MPWDWPVEVNNLEARAFCNWKSKKIDKKLRLPTEDEYLAIRNLLKADY
jgi:formylglycine-generating enzyme required for sulfatase activity